jgi:hypothetical protein
MPACVQFGCGLVQVSIALFQKLRFQLKSLLVLTNLLQKLLITVLRRVKLQLQLVQTFLVLATAMVEIGLAGVFLELGLLQLLVEFLGAELNFLDLCF